MNEFSALAGNTRDNFRLSPAGDYFFSLASVSIPTIKVVIVDRLDFHILLCVNLAETPAFQRYQDFRYSFFFPMIFSFYLSYVFDNSYSLVENSPALIAIIA